LDRIGNYDSKFGANHFTIATSQTPCFIINNRKEISFSVRFFADLKDASGTILNTIAATFAPVSVYRYLTRLSGYFPAVEGFSPEFYIHLGNSVADLMFKWQANNPAGKYLKHNI